VFPPDEAKGEKRTRVIHLTPPALQIVTRLLGVCRRGQLFLNAAGNPWTAQAMACRFGRLKEHVGVKFAAYDFRHGFCERLLESGADHLTVAALMGHADGKMVAAVYLHLGTADDHLRKTLTRASEGGVTD
jgi:integrase